MRQTYNPPILTEFGRIDQVTLGGSGDKTDAQYDISERQPTSEPVKPNMCGRKASADLYCKAICRKGDAYVRGNGQEKRLAREPNRQAPDR
jgi:hypothetical protein